MRVNDGGENDGNGRRIESRFGQMPKDLKGLSEAYGNARQTKCQSSISVPPIPSVVMRVFIYVFLSLSVRLSRPFPPNVSSPSHLGFYPRVGHSPLFASSRCSIRNKLSTEGRGALALSFFAVPV